MSSSSSRNTFSPICKLLQEAFTQSSKRTLSSSCILSEIRFVYFTLQIDVDARAESRGTGQLTKDQLLSVLPLLIPHLQNPAFVIHTYAALTIERILFIKQDGAFLYVLSLSCYLRIKSELS